MGKKGTPSKQICIRIPLALHSKLTTYADSNNETFTNACIRLLKVGLNQQLDPVATKSDIDTLRQTQEATTALICQAIKEQPITLQESPQPTKRAKLFNKHPKMLQKFAQFKQAKLLKVVQKNNKNYSKETA